MQAAGAGPGLQAGRIGYRTQEAGGYGETVIIANRSLDAVTRVDLWF
ncbi:hypothetical protein AB0F11_24815 [Streptomyces sp. NPDC032472]